MSGDPLAMTEPEAQVAAEQAAEEADYHRYRAELLRRAIAMPPHEVAALIEKAGLVAAERDAYRAALTDITENGRLVLVQDARAVARRALEPPF